MKWLLNQSERYRARIRSGPFFTRLAQVERPSDLTWIHQLLHQSREFTQAICLRYSLCHDKTYQRIFAEHAFQEADHPDQLVDWMGRYGFLSGAAPALPASQDTLNNLAYCWRAAVRESHDVQIVALNVVSEGVAHDFFAAVLPVLDRLGLSNGSYWQLHQEIDARHLQLGLEQCGDTAIDSPRGQLYQRVVWHASALYHQMLSSWVGEKAEPLTALFTGDGATGRLVEPLPPRAVVMGTIETAHCAKI
jgi:hypothetical protein